MKVNRWVMPVLSIVLLLGVIGAAQAAGLWATTGRGAVATGQGGGGGEGGGTGDGTGQVVKGWMTLADAADATGLPVETLAELTGAEDPAALDPQTPLNQMEQLVPGFTMVDFRDRIAAATSGTSP